jgi:hypothetical protein
VEAALLAGCKEPIRADTQTTVVTELTTLKRPKPGDCLVVTELDALCLDCNSDEADARRTLDRLDSATKKFWEVADELYPKGPFLRVTIANQSSHAGPPADPVFVHFQNKSYWLPIQALAAYEHISVYVPVSEYRGELYGVALGAEQVAEPENSSGFVVSQPSGTAWLGVNFETCQDCNPIWNPPQAEYGD